MSNDSQHKKMKNTTPTALSTKLMAMKAIVEIIAIVSVCGYFTYRVMTGYIEISMSLNVETERVADPNDENSDILAINVTLKNGNCGSLRLADAIAGVSFGENSAKIPRKKQLDGLVRYNFEDGLLIYGEAHPETPTSGLGPEQEIELSTYFKVPKDAICTVDVAVLAARYSQYDHPHETRASTVSLPVMRVNEKIAR